MLTTLSDDQVGLVSFEGVKVAPPSWSGVDEDEPVGDRKREPVEDVGDQIAFRVDDDHAAAGL